MQQLILYEEGFEDHMSPSDSQVDKLIGRLDKLTEALTNQQAIANHSAPMATLEERIGWHKRVGWVAIGGLVFLFGFVFLRMPHSADVDNAIYKGLVPVNDKMSAINEKLASLTSAMEFIKPDVSKTLPKTMKENLQRNGDLELGLKTVAALAEGAQERHIKTDPALLAEVDQELLQIKDRNSDFWRASTSLLNYKTFNLAPQQAVSLQAADIPNCTDAEPIPMKVKGIGPNGEIRQLANAYYQNCKLTLDSAEDDAKINSLILQKVPTIEFRNCLILYSGGNVTLITHTQLSNAPLLGGATINYNGPALQFVNCLFKFSTSNQLPPNVKTIIEALLSQPGPQLRIPTS